MERDTILEARGIRKVFRTGSEELEVLKQVDLEVARGELLAIMGVSGVGKSTLLHILGTLDRPTAGHLSIAGVEVASLADDNLARFRNLHIGFVFQFHHLLPEFTALENVMLPALVADQSEASVRDEAAALLQSVGLGKRLYHRPGELSGGERQRVAVVRALIRKPLVVLADEPSGNLDAASSQNLHELIRQLSREHQQAFVVMTHDRVLAESMDRLGHLEWGVLRMEAASGSKGDPS
ncbi:MAG: ABC transporter ATP-binding protein [Candidatus Latescibacteria bacterium]|nr:ABC transporter ATP-binding protein [Candidatus Latescibacterota bacterium]